MTATQTPLGQQQLGQSLDSLVSALELEPVESHLHPAGSFDVEAHPVPTGREEIWRYTPLDRLRGLHKDAEFTAMSAISTGELPPGASLTVVPTAENAGVSGFVPGDRIAARAQAAEPTSAVLDIQADVELREPITGVITTSSAEPAPGHLVIKVGRHARATVVLRFEGHATLAENVEVVVGDGAQLTLVVIDDWADDAVHVSHRQVLVGRDAAFKLVDVTFGGSLVRNDSTFMYSGPGGSVQAYGLYFADAGQHLEHRLFVDHTAPRTKSHVVYKGALQGQKAHTVWVGNVLIRKIAEGIETYEENRNLVLTDGAQADSVPNLEIETGEIEGAGHASATGRFDDEQLFYLRSRGISETEARRLVVHGFFNDLIKQIGIPELEEQLTATVEKELEGVTA